jgi:hypothetical protein
VDQLRRQDTFQGTKALPERGRISVSSGKRSNSVIILLLLTDAIEKVGFFDHRGLGVT